METSFSTVLMIIITQLSAVIIGVVSSSIVWWVTTKRLVPKIIISKEIARGKSSGGDTEYKIKIANISRYRDAYNITIYFVITYENKTSTFIKPNSVPFLEREVKGKTKDKSGEKYGESPNCRTIKINVNVLDKDQISRFFEHIEENEKLTLDYFFEAGQKEGKSVELRVILIGNDKYTNAPACILSKTFSRNEIKDGIFERGSKNMQVVPKERKQDIQIE
jgi:hypothetical protein